MSKFKVGDKVRVRRDGTIGVISRADDWRTFPYMLKDDPKQEPFEELELERVEPVREFILIHCDSGEVVTDRTPPVDGSSFDERAKLAFDRLMGREEPKPAPQPAPKFKVGDRVIIVETGEVGEISAISKSKCPYLVFHKHGFHSGQGYDVEVANPMHDGHCSWFNEEDLSPAPEPKYYTGRVVCVENTSMLCQEDFVIGKIYSISDGAVTSDSTCFAKTIMCSLKSVEHLNKMLGSKVKFAEVKE